MPREGGSKRGRKSKNIRKKLSEKYILFAGGGVFMTTLQVPVVCKGIDQSYF
jgi:hypothetical protein